MDRDERSLGRRAEGGLSRTSPSGFRPTPWIRFRMRFGRTMWSCFHGTATRWPCPRCRALFATWMEGLHDYVNVRLGKRPFRPESYGRFMGGDLDGGYHASCVGCRLYRVAAGLMGGYVPSWRSVANPAIISSVVEGIGRK